MVRLALLFFLASAASSAAAQTLYRCPGQGTNGATLIQDRPCPDGRAAASQLDARETYVSPQRRREIDHERARQARYLNSSSRLQHQGRVTTSRPMTDAQVRRIRCDAAKRNRDVRREALGLDRTYEILSALDRNVKDACKGVR